MVKIPPPHFKNMAGVWYTDFKPEPGRDYEKHYLFLSQRLPTLQKGRRHNETADGRKPTVQTAGNTLY